MIPSTVRIFVCMEPKDMRRSFDGLALAARQILGQDPRSGAMFVFTNRRGRQLRVLWWDHLYKTGDVIEVACWAHTRRYFFKALTSEPELAKHALSLIKGLFRIERAIKEAPRKKREQVRREQSQPLLDKFFQWCDEQAIVALDGTPISQALGYARNQRVALGRFVEDGRLPLDNNISERNLRREVVGRKNWLFLGSDEGARVNTIFVSLLASSTASTPGPISATSSASCARGLPIGSSSSPQPSGSRLSSSRTLRSA
jgi:hypothetical protein